MEYRAVGNHCALNLMLLKITLPGEEVLALLRRLGFFIVDIDLVSLARRGMAGARYHRGARPSEAPQTVDCSSFAKWLYGRRGIWLPRYTIQQRQLGEDVSLSHLLSGDLVFTKGRISWYDDDPETGVGHVGVATGNGTIIHAANSDSGVIEQPLEEFLRNDVFRGARRYLPSDRTVYTLEAPSRWEVETMDDLRWIILQHLA